MSTLRLSSLASLGGRKRGRKGEAKVKENDMEIENRRRDRARQSNMPRGQWGRILTPEENYGVVAFLSKLDWAEARSWLSTVMYG